MILSINNKLVSINGGLTNYFVPPPPEPGVVPNDMDFVYQAKDFDGTKIPNKAPNSTFGDYLQAGTLTVNGSGSTCYLSNGYSSSNYLYKDLTQQELTNIMANNSYYTFFVRMMHLDTGGMGGIMSCRLEGGYIYMIRNNGNMIQFHTSQWEDMGSDFLLDVDRVYKLVVGPNYYYGKNLDTGAEWSIDNYDERSMGNIMSTFNASSESELDRFYAFAGIARQTTVEEDLAIKDALMNQSL